MAKCLQARLDCGWLGPGFSIQYVNDTSSYVVPTIRVYNNAYTDTGTCQISDSQHCIYSFIYTPYTYLPTL